MAVNTERFFPQHQVRVRVRRRDLSKYLAFDSSRYLLHVVVLLCLMSLLTLGQTGILATRGYTVADLESRQTRLLREQNQLEVRYATAQSLDRIRRRASQIGLRPIRQDQIHYLTIVDEQLAANQE
ncbi:MAG: hypothetical protein HC884_12495 [Chloroflexaceae bacterium]|nr:hypothetical protein [Chloroflexaceae bacterium]